MKKITLLILTCFISFNLYSMNKCHRHNHKKVKIVETDEQFLQRIESSIDKKYNRIKNHQKRILLKLIELTTLDSVNFDNMDLNKQEKKRYSKLKGDFYRKSLKKDWNIIFDINVPNKKVIKKILLKKPTKFSKEYKKELIRQLFFNILTDQYEKIKKLKPKIKLTINGIDYEKYYDNPRIDNHKN